MRLVEEGREVLLTASIGIAPLDGAASAEEVLAKADTALFAAKRAGKGRTATFAESMLSELRAHLELEGDLRRAIETSELRLDYQPIVDSRHGTDSGARGIAPLGPSLRPPDTP